MARNIYVKITDKVKAKWKRSSPKSYHQTHHLFSVWNNTYGTPILYGKYTALNNYDMVRKIITAQFSSNFFFISRRKFQFGGYTSVTSHEHFLAFSLIKSGPGFAGFCEPILCSSNNASISDFQTFWT